MKNWKCAIGAALVTPICISIIFGFIIGLCWILENVLILRWLFIGAVGLLLVFIIWFVLFNECKEYWNNKKSNKQIQPTLGSAADFSVIPIGRQQMAKIIKWNEEQEKAWEEWVASRPEIIQDLCKKFPPYNLYRLKDTGQRVILYSYCKDGTMTVNVTGEYNAVMFDRQCFGIKPNDLEICELPKPDKRIGRVLTKEEDVNTFIDDIRLLESYVF